MSARRCDTRVTAAARATPYARLDGVRAEQFMPSRRSVLLAVPVALATACTSGRSTPATEADPDAAALAAAVASELALLAGYDLAIAVAGADRRAALAAARAAHADHLTALSERSPTRGTPRASTPSPGPVAGSDAGLRAVEATSAATLQQAAVASVRGDTAALLAAVAASHLILAGSDAD